MERTTIASIVAGIQRNDLKRRSARRSGWALLITAGLALPIIAGALDGTITLTTAMSRIGIAFVLSMFVTATVGSLMDSYQTQAALSTVEAALLAARELAEGTDDATPESTPTDDTEPAHR